jgi:hypothetical protein
MDELLQDRLRSPTSAEKFKGILHFSILEQGQSSGSSGRLGPKVITILAASLLFELVRLRTAPLL